MRPSASAASVPGSGAMCASHLSAVSERYGIDRDEPGTAAARFLRPRPEVQVGHDRVAAPDQDQPRGIELLDIHPDGRADRRAPSRLAGGRADRAVEQRRAQPMEEAAIHRASLQQAHRPRVGVGEDRLRAVRRRGNRSEPGGDRRERFVPRDALEAALALASHAPHRVQHPVLRVRALEIAGDLGAELAGRRRMVGRAADLDCAAVLDRDLQRAGVGAIVRAGPADDGSRSCGLRVERHGANDNARSSRPSRRGPRAKRAAAPARRTFRAPSVSRRARATRS